MRLGMSSTRARQQPAVNRYGVAISDAGDRSSPDDPSELGGEEDRPLPNRLRMMMYRSGPVAPPGATIHSVSYWWASNDVQ